MNPFLNDTTGHMILGGLLVLFFSPFFSLLEFPAYLSILGVPLLVSVFKELGDYWQWWPHEPSSFRQALHDISEWMFGAMVFTLFIALSRFWRRA